MVPTAKEEACLAPNKRGRSLTPRPSADEGFRAVIGQLRGELLEARLEHLDIRKAVHVKDELLPPANRSPH
jgi:hypothetical protein